MSKGGPLTRSKARRAEMLKVGETGLQYIQGGNDSEVKKKIKLRPSVNRLRKV